MPHWNEAGSTPMTVHGRPFITSFWSSAARGSPKRRLANWSPSSTTVVLPPGRSSSAVKLRPTAGVTRSSGRKSAVAARPRTSSVLSAAVSARLTPPNAASASKRVCRARQSRKLGNECENSGQPPSGLLSHTRISRSGSAHGSGRSMTALTTEKMAVVAPTPSASVITATAVKPGLCNNARIA